MRRRRLEEHGARDPPGRRLRRDADGGVVCGIRIIRVGLGVGVGGWSRKQRWRRLRAGLSSSHQGEHGTRLLESVPLMVSSRGGGVLLGRGRWRLWWAQALELGIRVGG